MANRKVAAVLVGLGALAAAGGCSKLQASLDRQETVTLGDVAARVAALEQRVADLEASSMAQAGAPETREPAASEARRLDARQLAAGDRAVVTTAFLRVRSGPDLGATQIGTLREGAVVQILAVEGDWAKIRFGRDDTGLTGWVSRQYIERQE